LEEALDPAARVFGPCSIKSMWKNEGEAGLAHPLVLAVGEEDINGYLGSIEEVAELGLPNGKVVWVVD
jgi:hypothetical protein